jgi:hypothetical protein
VVPALLAEAHDTLLAELRLEPVPATSAATVRQPIVLLYSPALSEREWSSYLRESPFNSVSLRMAISLRNCDAAVASDSGKRKCIASGSGKVCQRSVPKAIGREWRNFRQLIRGRIRVNGPQSKRMLIKLSC